MNGDALIMLARHNPGMHDLDHFVQPKDLPVAKELKF